MNKIKVRRANNVNIYNIFAENINFPVSGFYDTWISRHALCTLALVRLYVCLDECVTAAAQLCRRDAAAKLTSGLLYVLSAYSRPKLLSKKYISCLIPEVFERYWTWDTRFQKYNNSLDVIRRNASKYDNKTRKMTRKRIFHASKLKNLLRVLLVPDKFLESRKVRKTQHFSSYQQNSVEKSPKFNGIYITYHFQSYP